MDIKSGGLINLMEEISKLPSVQGVAWILLVAFSQIYSENQEQKADIKSLQFHQNGRACKVIAMENMVSEKISIKKYPKCAHFGSAYTKKKPSVLYQDNRKDD